MEYHGLDDGGGDFGDLLTEIWICPWCDEHLYIELDPRGRREGKQRL
jgi:hypothetical protein